MPQAYNYSWYPYRFIASRQSKEPFPSSGLVLVDATVRAIAQAGIPTERIYLLGFSQGACPALDYAAYYAARFAGVFALSGGLIGETLKAQTCVNPLFVWDVSIISFRYFSV